MKTVVVTKQETVKYQLSDIFLDISWAKISNKYFGKPCSWLHQKLDDSEFSYAERLHLKNALLDFSERIRIAAERIDT